MTLIDYAWAEALCQADHWRTIIQLSGQWDAGTPCQLRDHDGGGIVAVHAWGRTAVDTLDDVLVITWTVHHDGRVARRADVVTNRTTADRGEMRISLYTDDDLTNVIGGQHTAQEGAA